MKTIFRTHKKTGEVFALFPYEIADSNLNITYFSLSEGHSAADYHKMMKESVRIHKTFDSYPREEITCEKIIAHFASNPDPIKLEVIKNRSQTKFLRAVSEFRAKIN